MEWLTWMNSTLNLPALTVMPLSTVMILVVFNSPCSSSLRRMSPAVSRVQ